MYVNAGKPLRAVNKIITMPHPGFPTDAQAILMAVLCKANGTSIFEENIFENRYRHVDALVKMGADIKVIGFGYRPSWRSGNGSCRTWG